MNGDCLTFVDNLVHAATSPAGRSTTFIYNGSATALVAAGSYIVVATVNDTNYTGTATGTLVTARAAATVSLSNLTATSRRQFARRHRHDKFCWTQR